MLSEALPIYSGGLGNVAGDQLKAASDLGVPVVGVGLLYQQGYFRQVIDRTGAQQALFPYNDPGQLPIMPLREPNGEWLRLEIALARLFRVAARLGGAGGTASSSICSTATTRRISRPTGGSPANFTAAAPELRLSRNCSSASAGGGCCEPSVCKPEVCHLNEGHAAFAVLERARSFMEETGQPFRSGSGRHARGQSVHHAHARSRPASTASPRTSSSSTSAATPKRKLGICAARLAGAGRAESRRRVGALQHGLSGDPRQRRGQRREPAARRGEPAPVSAAVSALAGGRSAGRARHQRRPHADLGIGRGGRPLDGGLRRRPLAGDIETAGAGNPRRVRRAAVAIPHRRPRRRWSSTRASGCPDSWQPTGAPPRRWRRREHMFRSRTR